MLNKNKKIIKKPMVNFPIIYKDLNELNLLINLFVKNGFKVHESLLNLKEENRPIISISFGIPYIDGSEEEVIFMAPTRASYAAIWSAQFGKGIQIETLLKYFKEIFIDRDEDLFSELLNRDTKAL